MIFCHSGNSGDVIFSLPTIHHLTGGQKIATLYIKRAKYVYGDQYSFCKDFLLQQDCIKEVLPYDPPNAEDWNYFRWPGIRFDYDLDIARHQRNRGRIHIVKRYFDAFGIQTDHTRPWLKIDDENKINHKYALIHLTPRWNGLQYNWAKIFYEAEQRHGKVFFIGFFEEFRDFINRYNVLSMDFPTKNLLEMARLIRDCEALYCNQGVALTIAQGLGKEYYLVRNGTKTNCHLFTSNEHLLGAEYLAPYNTLNMPPDSHIIREK